MKIGLGLIVIALLFIFAYKIWDTEPAPQIETPSESIAGCYRARTGQDVYTLSILSQNGEAFEGTLSFKNFEKDSSSGAYQGTYKNGVLLGDYSFQSEGMFSVMQVIFKKSGTDFVRGYGPLNAEGTRFSDLNNITYDSSSTLSVFKQEDCGQVTGTP